jgi:capping protein alpha
MTAYLNRQFRKGTTQFSVYADQVSIKVEISCHNLNFKNYWGGEWLSNWILDLQTENISGSIKIHNHYFEQGNIQFNLNQSIPSTKLPNLSGKHIVDFINKSETNVI